MKTTGQGVLHNFHYETQHVGAFLFIACIRGCKVPFLNMFCTWPPKERDAMFVASRIGTDGACSSGLEATSQTGIHLHTSGGSRHLLRLQKTLAAVQTCANTCASVGFADHWYRKSDRLILARFNTAVSFACDRSKYRSHVDDQFCYSQTPIMGVGVTAA